MSDEHKDALCDLLRVTVPKSRLRDVLNSMEVTGEKEVPLIALLAQFEQPTTVDIAWAREILERYERLGCRDEAKR